MKIAEYTKVLSYVFPVVLRRGSSIYNPLLELILYRNQLQLATEDALYSDGKRYRPLVMAFNSIKEKLVNVQQILALGTGIGSIVQILNKMGHHPSFTLVDKDNMIIEWASEILQDFSVNKNLTLVCADASDYIDTAERKYDMVVIDIFNSRVVPQFVTGTAFLEKCRRRLNPGGIFILNYIVSDEASWQEVYANLENVFHSIRVLSNDMNRIIVATA